MRSHEKNCTTIPAIATVLECSPKRVFRAYLIAGGNITPAWIFGCRTLNFN